MRAFVAIDLPLEIQNELANWQATFRRLCPGARWTRPEGIHLTIKFLGEITDAQAGQVAQGLAGLETFQKFSVEIKSFGFFPDARRARVFWAGVATPPELVQLARRVEDALERLGFPREQRSLSPHLTLARFREPGPQPALREVAERHAHQVIGRFEVSELFLYESRLAPQGAEYRKVARFPAH